MSKYSTYQKMLGMKVKFWQLVVALIFFYGFFFLGIMFATRLEHQFTEHNISRGQNE
jgi:hypothetical protein